jgi:hypothetical protein
MIIATNNNKNKKNPNIKLIQYKNDFVMYDTYYSRLDFVKDLPNNSLVVFNCSYGGFFWDIAHQSAFASNVTSKAVLLKKNNHYYLYWSYYNQTNVYSQHILESQIDNCSFTRSTSTPSNRCYIFKIE